MTLLASQLRAAFGDLHSLAKRANFWDIFQDIFGRNYDSALAESIRKRWEDRDFSGTPKIIVTTSAVLGRANAAYSKDTNEIFVSDRFLSIATASEVKAVLLEEIGHSVDAVVNRTDTRGDEGELFSLRARGVTPTAQDLRRITADNDSSSVVVNGVKQSLELSVPVVYESEVIQAANFSLVNPPSFTPYQISGLNAAWMQRTGNNVILYLYNGTTKQAIANEAYTNVIDFDISGGSVVYEKKGDIYSYSAGVTTRLTTTASDESAPMVDGSTIVWKGWGTNSEEIFRRVGTTNVQLTNNAFFEESLQLSGSNLIWAAWDGTDYEIFLNDGTTTKALSRNSTDDYDPVIAGNRVAWFNWTGSQTNVWYYDGTRSFQVSNGEEVTDVVLCGTNLAYVVTDSATNLSSIKFYNTATRVFTTLATGLNGVTSLLGTASSVAWIEFKTSPTTVSSEAKVFDGVTTRTISTNPQRILALVDRKVVYEAFTSGKNALFLYDHSGATPTTTQLTTGDLSSGFNTSLDIVGNQILRNDRSGALLLTQPSTKPVLTIANTKVVEGLTSPQSVAVTVTLSAASATTVSVKYETFNSFTAASAFSGSDYTSTSGTLVFAPGQTTGTISIPILDDTSAEADEVFSVRLTDSVNAVVAPGLNEATVTITDTLEQTGAAGQTILLPDGVENLTLTGTTNINGTGNAGNNIIRGNNGHNILNGGGGFNDQLIGGLGNDTYIVTQSLFFSEFSPPPIKEELNQGIDTVSAVSSGSFNFFTLPDNIENLVVTGTSSFFQAVGNSLANQITGSLGNNSLDGSGGVDTVSYAATTAASSAVTISLQNSSASGGGGFDTLLGFENVIGSTFDDTIDGNDGANLLRGARGKDTITGRGGVDKFDYRVLVESLLGAANNSFDRITDFNAAVGGDQFLVPVARAGFLNAGAVATLDSAGLAAKLTAGAFLGNFAASFTFGTGPGLRTFVAINDATAGFSATTDAIVEITGLVGTVGLGSFATS